MITKKIITLQETMDVLKEKFGDVNSDIVQMQDLGLSFQSNLFSIENEDPIFLPNQGIL